MIQIDRKSTRPVTEQIVARLRYLIATGRFAEGDLLPSTRNLAARLGISFHTVRKAYQEAESLGLISSEIGSGFRVRTYEPLPKSQRMEEGATITGVLLEQLIGIGVDEEELEYLIQEQLSLLENERTMSVKIVVAGRFLEWGIRCSEQIQNALQIETSSSSLNDLERHSDADILVVPFRNIRSVLAAGTRADVVGIQTELGVDALAAVARLLERETLGIVTQFSDAIGPITTELRSQTRFSGQVLGASVQDGADHLEPLLKQCNLVLYTKGAERLTRSVLSRIKNHVPLEINVAHSSIQRLRQQIPV
jgi:GntR family transcriptional regulator